MGLGWEQSARAESRWPGAARARAVRALPFATRHSARGDCAWRPPTARPGAWGCQGLALGLGWAESARGESRWPAEAGARALRCAAGRSPRPLATRRDGRPPSQGRPTTGATARAGARKGKQLGRGTLPIGAVAAPLAARCWQRHCGCLALVPASWVVALWPFHGPPRPAAGLSAASAKRHGGSSCSAVSLVH